MAMITKALTLSGRLKPEARLGVALSEFAEALEEKQKGRFLQMRAQSNRFAPSAEDVIRMTEELNREGARLHKTWQPYSTRLGAFLTGLQSLASLGDVVIGGSQNLIACGSRVSTLFLKLGTSWALHRDLAQLFPRSPELQSYLAEYLINIVVLCKKVVVFGKKSSLSQFTTAFLSSFKSDFDPLLSELDHWARLIQQKANLLSTESMLNAESGAVERSMKLARRLSASGKRQRNFDLKQRLLLRLCPQQPEYEAQWRRQRRKGTCYWIFETAAYMNWRADARQVPRSTALWVWGSLGSGKTVVLANLVADIHLQQKCLFFFCSAKVQGSSRAQNIIGSLAYQIFNGISIEDPFWSSLGEDELLGEKASSVEGIVELLLAAIPKGEALFVIIDGLEECADDESSDVLAQFLKPLADARCLHLCCSSRPEPTLFSRFKSLLPGEHVYSVTLSNQARYQEIQNFINLEVERRRVDRPLEEELKSAIKSRLAAGAQGMYLWVSLQLEAMLPAYYGTVVTSSDIHDMLQNLPKDLAAAFDQALSRIRERRYRNQMFKLVALAKRPLGVDEMRVALTVVPGETTWRPKKLPPDGVAVVRQCGGTLVEVDEEDEGIHFIHHSVLLHLVQPSVNPETAVYHFSLEDAQVEMGCVCLAYLSYGIFDNRVGIQRKLDASQVADTIMHATTSTSPVMHKIAQHMVKRRTRASSSLDIGRIAQDILARKLQDQQKQQDVPRCLLPYTTTFWLDHTRQFHISMDLRVWDRWRALVEGELQHVKVPWNPASDGPAILEWAIEHSHGALFQYILHGQLVPLDDIHNIVSLFVGSEPRRLGIGSRWLDDIVAQFLESGLWDLDCIQLFLDAGASPVTTHHLTGMSPLQILLTKPWIGSRRREALVRCLISTRGVIDWANQSSLGELITTAIKNTHDSIALDLIKLKPVVDSPPSVTDDSPLGCAVALGRGNLIEALLSRGADPALSLYGGKPAIQIAFEFQKEYLVKAFATRRPGVVDTYTTQGPTMLYTAVLKAQHSMASLLLRLGADPNIPSPLSDELMPLAVAIKNEDAAIIKLLLRHGASTTFPWSTIEGGKITALHLALKLYAESGGKSWKRQAAVIDLLLQSKGQLSKAILATVDNETGNAALHHAAKLGRVNIQPFLDTGVDPNLANANGDTALHFAVMNITLHNHNQLERSKMLEDLVIPLLKAGAGPNIRNQRGLAAMELATSCNQSDVLETLVSYGGDPKVSTSSGGTLLHCTMAGNRTALVRFLLEHIDGDLASQRDTSGVNALELGILRGSNNCVQLLLDRTGGLEPYWNAGSSALLRALESIYQKSSTATMVNILLRAGANPNAVAESGDAILTGFLRGITDVAASDISRHVFRRNKKESLGYRDLKNELVDSVLGLITFGANSNLIIKGPGGSMPVLNYALQRGWPKIAAHLLNHGADPTTVGLRWLEKTQMDRKVLISNEEQYIWEEIEKKVRIGHEREHKLRSARKKDSGVGTLAEDASDLTI